MSLKDTLDRGDANKMAAASKAVGLGSRLHAGGVRFQRETLDVATAAAAPNYTVLQLLYVKTTGTGAAGVKAALINGGTPSTGEAAPNAGGTSITFNAETTGTGTCDVVYLTADPPLDANGFPYSDLAAEKEGLF